MKLQIFTFVKRTRPFHKNCKSSLSEKKRFAVSVKRTHKYQNVEHSYFALLNLRAVHSTRLPSLSWNFTYIPHLQYTSKVMRNLLCPTW